MKVAVITPIPTPYRDGFWQQVARQTGMQLQVFYCSGGKSDRPWTASWKRDFPWEVLPGHNLAAWHGIDASCYWNPQILQRLKNERYDALVLGGYNHPTMLAAVAYAERAGIPYHMMCESYGARPQSLWRGFLKRRIVSPILARAAGTFPTGQLATNYLIRMGANPDRVTRIPNVPDVEKLFHESQRLRHSADGISGSRPDSRQVLLFVGRLIPKKRADLLIRAFHRASIHNFARLVIVGDGPEMPALKLLRDQLGLAGDIELTGFKQPHEIVKWYSGADVFILPSSETWGVSVIEALSCQTPVIVSDEVGCHPDALVDARIGRIVGAGSENDLVRELHNVRSLVSLSTKQADGWDMLRRKFSYELLAREFSKAVERGLQG